MANVTLTGIDDHLLQALSDLAQKRRVSLESQIELALMEGYQQSRTRYLLETADRIAAMTPKDVVQTDSTILIREDRDRWL